MTGKRLLKANKYAILASGIHHTRFWMGNKCANSVLFPNEKIGG